MFAIIIVGFHMVVRRERKSRSYRGYRTHGWGRVGQHRKHGSKGGRGFAGFHKHFWTYVVKRDPYHFGKYGFKRPQSLLKKYKIINLSEIMEKVEELYSKGCISKDDKGNITIDLDKAGYDKLLGKGNITFKNVVIKVRAASKKAMNKIIGLGGKVILTGG